jgi:DNA-damage-inducible protein J
MDEALKKQAEDVFTDMGLSLTTAFTLFTKAVIRQGKIPFEIAVTDSFYSTTNQEHLMKAIATLNTGENMVVKTMEELEAMEHE